MNKSIFDFSSYKSYLLSYCGGRGTRNGKKKKMAHFVGCQTTYLSQVLNGPADLSLEQGFLLNAFLEHTEEQAEYFMLLLQADRAGTKELQKYFKEKANAILESRRLIQRRVKNEPGLSEEDKSIYYSSWIYPCLHVMVSVPELQTKEAMAARLRLPLAIVTSALEFLQSRELIIKKNGTLQIGPRHIHLSEDSPYIRQHHTNWRRRALESLDVISKDDLHYSVVFSLSKKDAAKIRADILDLIQKSMALVRDSQEECVWSLGIDLVEV